MKCLFETKSGSKVTTSLDKNKGKSDLKASIIIIRMHVCSILICHTIKKTEPYIRPKIYGVTGVIFP